MIDKETERKCGVGLSYVNTILQALLGFFYVPLLLHYLGTSQYGLYQLMGSLIAYFSIMDFGLSTAVIRFYVYYENKTIEEFEGFLATAHKIYIIIAILAALIGGSVYCFLDVIFATGLSKQEIYEAKQIYILLLVNIIFSLVGMLYRAIITANENFLFLKGVELFQLLMQPFLVIVVLNQWPTAYAMAAVMTIINICLTVFRAMFCRYDLHIKIMDFKYSFQWGVFYQLRKLMISTFLISIVDQIFLKANQIILGVVSNTGAVAIYSIAALIYTSYLSLSYAISGIFLPKVTTLVLNNATKKEISDLFIKIGSFQYAIYGLVLSGFIIFGKEFIVAWAGSEFLDSWLMALLIMVPYTIDMIQNIGLAILQAKNLYEVRARVYIVTGIMNIVLSCYLGKYYGGIGCALSTSVSLFCCNVIMNICYYKYVHLDLKRFWKKILEITVFIFMISIIGFEGNALIDDRSIFYLALKILAYTVLYVGIICVAFQKYRKYGFL